MKKLIFTAVLSVFIIFAVFQHTYSATETELTKLLLHFDGSDGSYNFTDEAGKTVSVYGNAQIDTVQSKFGGASGLFSGSDYLIIPYSVDWDFGAGDFTIEFWTRFNNLQNTCFITRTRTSDANGDAISIIYNNTANKFYIYIMDTLALNPSWAPSINIWYHIALVRSGSSVYLFVNGVQLGATGTNTSVISSTKRLCIASDDYAAKGTYLNGWLDELRISKGIARWTSNFTPASRSYSLTATSSIPHLINYQGRLTNTSGNPLNGSYDLTFRIYDAETAGNLLWEETHSGVVIQKGIFSVLLGSVVNLDLPFDTQYFLEIKVGTEVMSPRQQISSAGYAIRAATSETADSANNSQTVGNIGVSTTPQANKILPLDSNGKLPGSEGLLGNNIVVLSGVISDGATIPLPAGYTESQCKWIVSYANTTQAQFPAMDGWGWVKCFATGRVITAKCGGTGPGSGTYPSDANYIIIGVK